MKPREYLGYTWCLLAGMSFSRPRPAAFEDERMLVEPSTHFLTTKRLVISLTCFGVLPLLLLS